MENFGTINNFGNQNFGKAENMTYSVHPNQGEHSEINDMWKENALQLVSKGQLKEALTEVVKAFHNDSHVKNQVVLLLGRISQLEVDVIAGSISKPAEAEEFNRIRQGAVSLITSL